MCVCVLCGRCEGPGAPVCVCGGGGCGAGRDVSVCGWACMCGVWAETEAEGHSQAKDNAVCVFVGARRCVVFSVACGAV